MTQSELHRISASEAARLIRDGMFSSADLVEACLARIAEIDSRVEAWAFLDPDYARAQARAADELRLTGRPVGPLHGVPVGVKDIFDTADMPTEFGSRLHRGRTPSRDATVVSLLRATGAIVLGKTVTTEFAYFAPGKTRNPHNPEHTPGGSSSGSAAAVGASMVPLAIGSQTNGSTIRPAAYCGVVGFKPTHGTISRHGALRLSRTLDHVGLFANSIEDIALLAEQLAGYDENDPDTRPQARTPFSQTAADEPPLPPLFAFIKTPRWQTVDQDTREGFNEIIEALGGQVEEIELFPSAAEGWQWHQAIMAAEMADSLEREWKRGKNRLSEPLRAQIRAGRGVRATEYLQALGRIAPLSASFAELFEQRYDAILTPAAPGAAPRGLTGTGDPGFCTLWTLCGMPAVTLPLLQSVEGLPIGVQLVGPRHGDARLLRTARWLAARMAGS